MALIGPRPALWRQAAVVLAAQAALHSVFALSGPGGSPTAEPHALHGMHAAAPMQPGATMVHGSPGMWAGHALAALLTLLAWRYGEQAFWALLRLARETVAAVLLPSATLAPLFAPAVRAPVVRAPLLPRERRGGRSRPRRGPPVRTAPA